MAIEINLTSPLPPDRVLDAIREDAREWRESKIPREIRDRGVLQMMARIEPPKFKLWLDRRWSRYRGGAPLHLAGTVAARADGGSDITGRCTRSGSFWILSVIFAALAVYDIGRRVLGYSSSRDWWIYVMLAVVMLGLDEFNDWRVNQTDPEAVYLVDRLTDAVAAGERTVPQPQRTI